MEQEGGLRKPPEWTRYLGAAPMLYSDVVVPMWNGDQSRMNEIKSAQDEALKSEWNTAKVTPQEINSYNNWLSEYNKSLVNEKYGLSDEEKALATNTNAQNMNFAEQNALRVGGGNASAYISGVLNQGQNQFGLDLASRDAEIKRQKRMQTLSSLEGLNRSAGVFQDVNNLNFQKQMLSEQALGQAESDWYANRANDRRALVSTAGSVAGAAAKVGAV
jgi:hypothetical protein